MNARLRHTVQEMYRLAREYGSDTSRFDLRTVYEVFDATRRIPYVRDSNNYPGHAEMLTRPLITASRGGDCDDKAIFAAGALTELQIPWRIVTVSYRPDGQMQHTYLEIQPTAEGKWLPFDATYATNRIFEERSFTKKYRWKNPFTGNESEHMRQTQYLGVSTLEGNGGNLGLIPALPAAVPAVVSLISKFEGVTKFIKDIPVIGGLFKGKTQHIDHETAARKGQEMLSYIHSVYDALDASGRKILVDAAENFFRWQWPHWAISKQLQQSWQDWSGGKTPPDRDGVGWKIHAPLYWHLRLADASRIDDHINREYLAPFNQIVKTPLDTYVRGRYGSTTDELVSKPQTSSGSSLSQQAASISGKISPWVIGGVAVALLLGASRRKGR